MNEEESDLLNGYNGATDVEPATAATGERPESGSDEICGDCDCN